MDTVINSFLHQNHVAISFWHAKTLSIISLAPIRTESSKYHSCAHNFFFFQLTKMPWKLCYVWVAITTNTHSILLHAPTSTSLDEANTRSSFMLLKQKICLAVSSYEYCLYKKRIVVQWDAIQCGVLYKGKIKQGILFHFYSTLWDVGYRVVWYQCAQISVLHNMDAHSSNIWRLKRQEQASKAWINNCIPQNIVKCNCLSLSEIPASGTKVIICSEAKYRLI